MFVGYSLDHPTDTYHFISLSINPQTLSLHQFNLSTKRIIHSRDVKWLDKA